LTQQATDKSASVDASASNIEYQESAERIRLTGNAKILQAGAVIEGNTIDYEVGTQRVMAAGSLKDDTSQRVKVTLPPSTLRDGQ
jgi:lipopolysaccharide transport protein LptA